MAGKGSKPGERRGGRQKGTPNKATAAREAAVASSGLTPLEYMLNVLRDEEQSMAVRLDAANKAAPYIHPKRAPVDGAGDTWRPNGGGPTVEEMVKLSREDRATLRAIIGRAAGEPEGDGTRH